MESDGGYTRFACRAAKARVAGTEIQISVAVSNIGDAAAQTPVLAFVSPPGGIERWPFALQAFSRVALAPGETRVVRLTIDRASVRWRDPVVHGWREENGQYKVIVATGADQRQMTGFIL